MERYEGDKFNAGAGSAAMDSRLAPRLGQQYADVPKNPRESGLLTEVERLGHAVSEHEALIGQIITRLTPIIRQEPSDAANTSAPSPPQSFLCHVGDVVRDERKRIETITGLLREISRRIDL
jgi:hypothetical protein